MKALIVLLICPVVCLGRVNEKLDDFKKRVAVKPFIEHTEDGITAAVFQVEGIEVEVYASRGIICFEQYNGVTSDTAKAIMQKQAGTFTLVDGLSEATWTDRLKGITGKWSRDRYADRYFLTVSNSDGESVRRRAKLEPEKKTEPAKASKF